MSDNAETEGRRGRSSGNESSRSSGNNNRNSSNRDSDNRDSRGSSRDSGNRSSNKSGASGGRSSKSSSKSGSSKSGSSKSGSSKSGSSKSGGEPRIGDSRPALSGGDNGGSESSDSSRGGGRGRSRSRNNRDDGDQSGQGSSKSRSNNKQNNSGQKPRQSSGSGRSGSDSGGGSSQGDGSGRRRRRGGRGRGRSGKGNAQGYSSGEAVELSEETLALRRGKQRDGKNIGRYTMCVHVAEEARHIAILEGRNLIEYYVSRPTDDATQIHGNVYMGRVQNVLPGMEAAFIDISTPKNAVLYRGDVQFDPKEHEGQRHPRIEQMLKAKSMILCQVTKNPIAHKGARLTQEVSLPGRFVVLVPNSSTYGISKRLPDGERKRLRNILDSVKPKQHGVIVRTAAENVTAEELQRDVSRLLNQWERIQELSAQNGPPRLLYREPDLTVRLIREELTKEYASVQIDDQTLFEEVHGYVSSVSPALSDRIEMYDAGEERLSMFERYHVQEQLEKALDKKVWLPGGGSLIIEHTEALTVIDVNTGKNVGRSNLEDTVFRNNMEAATEVARQLRLRDVGGIIVIDFVDMESHKNRAKVTELFREELARDKTRTQVYEISDLGLVEMTRKRIGEGLKESVSHICETCEGSGAQIDTALLADL